MFFKYKTLLKNYFINKFILMSVSPTKYIFIFIIIFIFYFRTITYRFLVVIKKIPPGNFGNYPNTMS